MDKPIFCFKDCPNIQPDGYFQGRCKISGICLPKMDDGRYKRDWNMASIYFPRCPDLLSKE